MQLSKQKINERIEKQIFEIFYQVVADIKKPDEAKAFFNNILTETELEAIAKRLAVAHYLEKGRSYTNIKENLQVSSATVATIAEQMKKGGFRIALKKVQAEEWADKWVQKINRMMGKKP